MVDGAGPGVGIPLGTTTGGEAALETLGPVAGLLTVAKLVAYRAGFQPW